MDKREAPGKEGDTDKQCLGEGNLIRYQGLWTLA